MDECRPDEQDGQNGDLTLNILFIRSRHSSECGEDARCVACQQARDVEAKAGELDALDDPVLVGLTQHIRAIAELEPVDRVVQDTPDDVFAHAVPPVRLFLLVEIVVRAAGRHLDEELRRTFQVVILV